MADARPAAIEPWSNRRVIHRLSAALLPHAVRLGISPHLVSAAGLAMGLAAAVAYAQWRDPWMAAAGFVLMVGWHVLDGLDGALARATGRASAIGRLIDGIADYLVFIAVNVALVFSHTPPWPALTMALVAGAAHIAQSAFYEGTRETYVRRLQGRFEARPRPTAGGWLAWGHNRLESLAANRTSALDRRLAAAPPATRAALLARWEAAAAPAIRRLALLSANCRTLAILAACLAGSPFYYWAFEILVLSAVALAGARQLGLAERHAMAGLAADRE